MLGYTNSSELLGKGLDILVPEVCCRVLIPLTQRDARCAGRAQSARLVCEEVVHRCAAVSSARVRTAILRKLQWAIFVVRWASR